eukprot:1161880-Pelagomonas_calceolata.AAC.1
MGFARPAKKTQNLRTPAFLRLIQRAFDLHSSLSPTLHLRSLKSLLPSPVPALVPPAPPASLLIYVMQACADNLLPASPVLALMGSSSTHIT